MNGGLFRRIVEGLTRHFRYLGVYEYRVVSVELDQIDVQAVDRSLGLDDHRLTYVHPGVPGAKGSPSLGSTVLVGFVNGDRSRPYVAAFASPSDGGFLPVDQEIDAVLDTTVGHSVPVNPPDAKGRHLCIGDMIVSPMGPFTLELAPLTDNGMASTKRKPLGP